MDCKIYLITDCDKKKYVGKTIQTLKRRLTDHKSDKNSRYNFCSSQLLNLNDCKIELLEKCNIEDSQERERYWINKIDCVNMVKFKGYRSQTEIEYESSEKRIKAKREWNKKKYLYVKSWGGDLRSQNNNLLKINPKLFS